jgi:hypothetical protein
MGEDFRARRNLRALKARLCPEREAAGPLPTYAAVGVSVSLLSAGASGTAMSGCTASASASVGGNPAETNCRKRVAIQSSA